MRKLMFLPLVAFLFSCGSSTDEKEVELLKKENELLKREQLLNSKLSTPLEKPKPFDWSGIYEAYSDDVAYTAKAYYNGKYDVYLKAEGRQTYFSIVCNCIPNDTILKCYYKETRDGNILGSFDSSEPIFVLKKKTQNSFKGFFNGLTITDNFSRTVPVDSVMSF